ncbi:MAG: Gfo/Idh/MocA family oxidoreductase, partial [Ruthenibacterium sp.]
CTWEELLSKNKMADCAMVCTQDKMHTQPVMAALHKGYHVLCEKPMSPSAAECIAMEKTAQECGRTLTVCHVLRYSPFYTRLKKLLDENAIGELVSLQHIECVGYWHQAHSFVRGNWRSSSETSPMILAKACHDMDLLAWLVGAPCKEVSSYGSLKHFKKENAPQGSTPRCFDGCKVTHTCPYYCGKIYLEDEKWYSPVIRKVVALDGTREAVAAALKTGPYGRCVYHCDNDVVDHQVVNLQFANDVTASFTMCAFTYEGSRIMNLMGTRGQIKADMEKNTIEVFDFLTGNQDVITIETGVGGHSGSDEAFVRGFLRMVETNGAYALSSASQSVQSHLIALAAEQSRVTGQSVCMDAFIKGQKSESHEKL